MILLKHYDSYIIVTGEKSMFLFSLLTEQYFSLYVFLWVYYFLPHPGYGNLGVGGHGGVGLGGGGLGGHGGG